MKKKIVISGVVLVLSFGLSGCGGYAPDMGSLNPFGNGEQEQQRRQQPQGPLVMPGEMDNQSSQQQSQDDRRMRPRSSSQRRTTQQKSGTVDFSETQTAQNQSGQSSPSMSSPIIKPSITNTKKAKKLADEAHQAHKQGDFRQAIQKFKRASEMDPSNPEYVINLGSLHFNQKNYSQAKKHYQRAASMVPKDAEVQVYLGATHLRLGERNQAKQRLQKALQIDPDNKMARSLLNQI